MLRYQGIRASGRPVIVYLQAPEATFIGSPVPVVDAANTSDAPQANGNGNSDPSSSSGSALLVGFGVASVTRIPVPGTGGLYLELKPRGWIPSGGSTSTVFIQDATGKRVLRLDYGYNKSTGGIDYHWNQKGTFAEFGIADHTSVGRAGELAYKGARYFRYAGRLLLVAGLAMDVYSIVVAKRRWRQVARVAAGWGGAEAGCATVGGWAAGGGTAVEPGGGTAIAGLFGCALGGIGGYLGASWAAGEIYDWVEEEFFDPIPSTDSPEP